MVALLDLPSEILFEILDLVIVPIHWPKGSVRYRPESGTTPVFPRSRYCVSKLELVGRHPAVDLLLTSRRLYTATKIYLSKKPQTLDLDVAIVDNHWIWPTWRTLPVRKDGVFKRIDVHFIHCFTEDERYLQTDWDQNSVLGIGRSTDAHWSSPNGYLHWQSFNPLRNLVGNENVNASVTNTLSYFLQQPFSGEIMGYPVISRTETLAFHIDTRSYGDGNKLLSESEVPLRKICGLAHLDFTKLYSAKVENARLLFESIQGYVKFWLREWKEKEDLSPRIGRILFVFDGMIVESLEQGNTEWVLQEATKVNGDERTTDNVAS
ncbi:hypothetical protein yc1106_00630 [Curvularia clavata]|uniref:Uncharacterized protein n=1 Tax=Curvularia clavata TaxID=95742 RepID=A0A9Q9DPI6_CURCL|nr:hypothetical protein yc1106_00630 [Curvularia clavata]